MTAKLTILITLTLTTLGASAAHADGRSRVGLRGLKAMINSMSTTQPTLSNTGTDEKAVKLEEKLLNQRNRFDQLTSIDALLEKVELNRDSVFVRFDF